MSDFALRPFRHSSWPGVTISKLWLTTILGKVKQMTPHLFPSFTFRTWQHQSSCKSSLLSIKILARWPNNIPWGCNFIVHSWSAWLLLLLQLTPENIFDILYTADLCLLPGLKSQCSHALGRFITTTNVVQMLRTARLFSLVRLEDQCAEFIAGNLEPVSASLANIFGSLMSIICWDEKRNPLIVSNFVSLISCTVLSHFLFWTSEIWSFTPLIWQSIQFWSSLRLPECKTMCTTVPVWWLNHPAFYSSDQFIFGAWATEAHRRIFSQSYWASCIF